MPNHPNHAPAVQNLQRYLRQLSFDEATIAPVPIDGIFDTATETSLREFQRLRGLPVTGVADRETWEQLYADYRASLSLNSPPRPIAVFPLEPPWYVLTRGARGFAVLVLQHMLRELHQNHSELSQLTPTGEYDEPTEAAVRLFQERNRLPVDGSVGLLTWNAIADRYNILFARQGVE